MVDVSVIICTHNPRPDYLIRVLAGLRSQTLPMEQWELLVVDNASQEPLTSQNCDLSWHPCGRLIREEELGLSAARRRGSREAAAELLVFVDDDNVLEAHYCAEAIRIGREWPPLGAWGGSVIHEYEVQPLGHLRGSMDVLGHRDVKSRRWSNVITCSDALPIGAGLCVRANIVKAYAEQYEKAAIQLSGRRGASLVGGEDYEICYVACRLGQGMGLFPELKLTHLIPKERVREDYLLKITEGTHISSILLAYKWRGVLPRSPFSTLGALSILKNILINRGFDRRKYFAFLRATIRARRIIAEGQSGTVERGGIGQGARDGAAEDRASRPD